MTGGAKLTEASSGRRPGVPRFIADRGLCHDPAVLPEHPGAWTSDVIAEQRLAREVCDVCPVREPCLEFALEQGETAGIWGGQTTRARNMILRRRAGLEGAP